MQQNTLKTLAFIQSAFAALQVKCLAFSKEEHGGSEIVAVVAVAAVAVALAIVFKGQLETLIRTVVGGFTQKLTF